MPSLFICGQHRCPNHSVINFERIHHATISISHGPSHRICHRVRRRNCGDGQPCRVHGEGAAERCTRSVQKGYSRIDFINRVSGWREGCEMIFQCPRCGSSCIVTKDHGRKTICTAGAIAGAFGGVTGIAGGAEIGVMAGLVAGPPGMIFGGIAGAIVGALAGAAAGGAAGAALGEIVDDNILDNFFCLSCEFSFGTAISSAPEQAVPESS
jgi:hypothetical protein